MDYYAILNLSPQANSEDIKRAFRRLARQFHPDVAGEGSRERFEQIYQAYQVLSNPEERRRYDAQRHSPPSSVRGGKARGCTHHWVRLHLSRTTGSGIP
jgi:molecular chaperone DnaJ